MIKKMIFLGIAVLSAIPIFANELNVYPIPAVFTSKNVENSAFKKVLFNNRSVFVKEYLTIFDKYFPNANKEISDKTKYKTFATYVNVPRASIYPVKKSEDLLDIYLPLTMSINFVNMASGETLYCYPITNYFKYETTFTNNKNKRQETIFNLCQKNYEQTLEEVIKHAAQDFKPFDITAKIVDNYRSLYILNKGLETGIAKGDLLTDESYNQISVIYSNFGYSVAKKVLGKPDTSGNFSKFANCSITQLKKPKILFINDFDDEKLYNIFSTALGNNANFSLINTDKTFFDMQQALVSLNMNFKNNNIYNRTMPDYFLKLYFAKPIYAQYKSSQDYYNVDRYGMIACGVVFDKSGRVVYSQCANEELKNEVVGDIRFKDVANYEIIAKNILINIAETMQKNIQFKTCKFKIKNNNNQYLKLKDTSGYLKSGNIITVFKKIKTEKLGKEILIPTWDYRVINTDNGIAECKMSLPYVEGIDYPSKRDIVQMNTIIKSANKTNMYNYNSDLVALEGNEVKINNFEQIAFAAMSSTLKAPIVMPSADFSEQIKELNSLGFKDRIEILDNTENLTIKPVYKAVFVSEKVRGTVLKKEYEVTVGIVAKKDGEIVKKDGLRQNVTFYVPQGDNNSIVEYELLKAIYPLLQQVARKF